MRTLRMLVPAMVVAAGLLGPGAARADQEYARFVGIHPIAPEYGGGFCYIEFPHVHIYAPTRADVLYRPHDEGHFFVGDPVPYGYEGPKHAFYGPHPIPVSYVLGDDGDETDYCYLEGPHYHSFEPPPQMQTQFKLKGGVYFYAGDLPRVYVDGRPRYAKINAVYKPLHYQRPVVVVAPPPEYRGPVVVDEPTYVEPVRAEAGVGFHAGVSFGLPSITIGSPPPRTIVVERPVVYEQPREVVVVRDHRPRTVVIHEIHDRPTRVIVVKDKRNHGHDHDDDHDHGRDHGRGRWK